MLVHQLQNTPAGQIIGRLMVEALEAKQRIRSLERQVKKLKRKAADSVDWSQHYPREVA